MYTNPTGIIVLLIVFCLVLLLLLSSVIIIVVFKYQKRQNKYANEINTLKAEYENAILKSQIEIQEQTFQNISREIHDNVGQKLSLAKLYLSDSQNPSSDLYNTAAIIGDAISDLRDLSRTLSSEMIISNGLIHALKHEIQYIDRTSLFKVYFEIKGDSLFLEDKIELVIFRVIQEAIQNVIKHAKASAVTICLEYHSTELNVLIKDNGIGYCEINSEGQGLKNMKGRAKLLGGSFEIKGDSYKGTVIEIKIPLDEKQQL